MANQVEHKLQDKLLTALQKERFVLLATTDYELGSPNVSAISWVYAPDSEHVRFAVNTSSRIVENIKAHAGVVLNVIIDGSSYSIAGEARFITERMEGIPLKLAFMEVDIQEVRDVMFYGAQISEEPKYDKTYDLDAAAKLDRQVMGALKEA
ncbi:pyridoxamine 5'-phosphate oxidase family protein [Salsuginibacillus kocurii]|uniref:pyridoxamine 5'-phosphate oxidase family protein n=1 Tax=Salsuginibacillus kocurii TaxID=427078 RepID=UPI00036F7E7A|nr:pyridoxamine 5'-phosphate oxidase family protein [Salsuginibacillus kocurii]